jgi:hypothetical protein
MAELRLVGGLLVAAVCTALAPTAWAQAPLRLRGDVLGSARAPAGLVALSADSELRPWLDVEAMLWAEGGELGTEADALVAVVRLTDPGGRGHLRIGRMVVATGAIRPLHLDGLHVLGRLPWRGTLEVFGGAPVVPRLGARSYDWAVGARASQRVLDLASIGVGWIHRREGGRLSDQEVSADLVLTPWDRFDLNARAAWDLIEPGVSEAGGNASLRLGSVRIDAFGIHRVPTRILPATSLFTVLGDIASTHTGGELRWRAAPRLDLAASGGVRLVEDDIGEDLTLRATLRLDARGAGRVTIKGRRFGMPDASWTGARLVVQVPVVADVITVSTELELVVPDDDRRGAVWPWALVAARWRPHPSWELAAAFEASASAQNTSAFDGILRAAYQWEGP